MRSPDGPSRRKEGQIPERGAGNAWLWLLRKEWRELRASRSWWLMLVLIGPLVGISFISAVGTYAEASGLNGTSSGVGEAFSPLIGIWGPTFSACEIAAVFLLPFVAIRLVAGDRQTGALKIELQHPMSSIARLAAKTLVLLAGWAIANLAPAVAVLLWFSYGGNVNAPELATVASGHLLNAGLTIALAAAAASIADHPSTAAILTLAVTVGTWILNFVAAVQGGVWERLAGYTPTAMVAAFQHGLIRLDVVLAAVALIGAGLGLSAIWMRIGIAVAQRVRESLVLACAVVVALLACTLPTSSWDVSENRNNSFPLADERALRKVRDPLRLEVHLAPQDPRRYEIEQRTLSKLRRILPSTKIDYVSATSIGLLEQSSENYGEIRYELGGRTAVGRSVTPESVLETIYGLAGVEPRSETSDPIFRGHPLAVPPKGAAAIFYGVWPAAVLCTAIAIRRRRG